MFSLYDAVIVDDGRRHPLTAVGIAGDRIVALGGDPGGAAVPLGGHLVLPGLVNGHDHLHLNVFPRTRRRRYDHSADWVADMAAAIEAEPISALRRLPRDARAWHGALKNAIAGATTVVHHDPWLAVFDCPDFPVNVVRDIGWAHSLHLEGAYGPLWVESLAGTPPHRPWFIHLAEGTDARARAELEVLARGGGLTARTRLVHAVGLAAADTARAIAAGTGMVWCPASNRFLLGRAADVRPWAGAGRAALGTDARLTGSRDLLDELAMAAGTGACPAGALLEMVTTTGAGLCGRAEAGRIAAGGPADLVVLYDDGRAPAAQLIGARRADLRLVIACGRPIIADHDLGGVFDAAGVACRPARLDGRPKLIATRAVQPLLEAGIAEPGLELDDPAPRGSRRRRIGGAVAARVTAGAPGAG